MRKSQDLLEGWGSTTLTSQSQNSHRNLLKPLLFPGVLAFLANSAIHQSLSILLIISIAETPLIGSGLNMQGTVQVKTKNIYDLIGHRIKLNIDMQITNRKVRSAGQRISKETIPRQTSFPFPFFKV